MIYVFGLSNGLNAFRAYRALGAAGLADGRIFEGYETIPYRDLLGSTEHRFFEGAHIFTDLYLLDARQTERLGAIIRRLRQSPLGLRLLNDPLTFPDRYGLLRRLHEDGTNDHNVYHVTERRTPERWPVFVRSALGHWHSPLLHDAAELDAFLLSLISEGVWHGDKLIVEFNETRRPDGYYRRNSAYRIGARIVPWRPNIARHWWLRRPDLDPADYPDGDAEATEQIDYMRANPHADELREIFDRFDVQFGRIDYSVKDGRIQVWEINVSPMLPRPKMYETTPAGRRVVDLACELLFEAFTALDGETRT